MNLRETTGLRWFRSQLDGPGRTRLDGMLREAAAEIAAVPPGPERARLIHARIDSLQAAFLASRPDLAARVRCGKGCGACCRVWVGITSDEAALLAERVRNGAAVDRSRLETQATCADAAAFLALPLALARCVFLDDAGACSIHEDRPAACRLVLVASDPSLCGQADLATRVQAVVCPDAELLASASLSADTRQSSAGSQSLSAGLLEEIHRRGTMDSTCL